MENKILVHEQLVEALGEKVFKERTLEDYLDDAGEVITIYTESGRARVYVEPTDVRGVKLYPVISSGDFVEISVE